MPRVLEHIAPSDTSPDLDYWVDRSTSVFAEHFSEKFLSRTLELNRFVLESGEKFEGSVFYWNDSETNTHAFPVATLAPARRNLWRASRFKKCMLEIGVNAGHSALLALSLNPNLIYYGVDINWHKYTGICAQFLRQEFGERFNFFAGDSREVLPHLAEQTNLPDFDLFHVDGGHSREICYADISNCLRLANKSADAIASHLLLDDVNASWIYDVYCQYVSSGHLMSETFFFDWEDTNRNVLARIFKRKF